MDDADDNHVVAFEFHPMITRAEKAAQQAHGAALLKNPRYPRAAVALSRCKLERPVTRRVAGAMWFRHLPPVRSASRH